LPSRVIQTPFLYFSWIHFIMQKVKRQVHVWNNPNRNLYRVKRG